MSQGSQLIEFPFAGRTKELEVLDRLLDEALTGEGSLSFITGEAGVGKTRLAKEFLNKGKAKGFFCLTAKCPKGGSLLPYSVWVECLRQLTLKMSVHEFFEACGNFSRQIVKLLPELDAARTEEHQSTPGDFPKQPGTELTFASPVQIFDAVTQFFFRFSSRTPLIILLDDLQWSDKTSLGLLRHLVESGFESHRLILLCIYRDTYIQDENPDLHKLIQEVSTTETRKILLLQRFDPASTRNLIRSARDMSRVPDSFCDLLYKKTGGNPLFVRELLALLGERADPSAHPSMTWKSLSPLEIEVPDTAKEVVRQRLAPLGKEVIEVLRVAALIGEEFDLGILRQTSNTLDEVRLFELIQTSTKTGIVRRKKTEPGNTLYCFDDEITMDVLTETISPERLVAYHLAIGEIIERAHIERINEHAAELAFHFRRGADWQKCLEYSTKAGDFAAATYAHDEASNHYVTALESLDKLRSEGPPKTRGRILERAGDEYNSLGHPFSSFQSWEEAIKEYEAEGDMGRAAELHRKVGWRYTIAYITTATPNKALAHFEAARSVIERGRRGPPLAYLYHCFATWHWYFGDVEKAREYCDKSIQIAREYKIEEVEAMCNTILGCISPISDIQTAMKLFRKSEMFGMEEGRTNFDIYPSARLVHMRLGWGYCWATHDIKTALAHLLDALRYFQKVSSAAGILYLQNMASTFGYLPLGEWSKIKGELSDATSTSVIESYPHIRALTYVALGNICLRQGELEDAENWLTKSYADFRELSLDSGFVATTRVQHLHGAFAQLCLERGELGRAEKYLREGYSILKKRALVVDSALGMAVILALLVETCQKQGKRLEALSYLGELGNLVKLTDQDWARAYYHTAAGIMASEMEEWGRALENYEEAARCWKVLSHPYELAKAYHEMALVHLNTGKIETANGLFENARGIFEKLGAKLDLGKVTTAREAIQDASAFSILRLRGSAKEDSRSIFDYLVTSFIGDYYAKKMSPEESGWRTLGDIAHQTKIPVSAFYQRDSKKSGGLGELERIGLVEVRLYSGQRGRGGKITRVRIAYERDEIKKHVARRVSKVPLRTMS